MGTSRARSSCSTTRKIPVATLVRATSASQARMTVPDRTGATTTFQTEMADRLRDAGAAFYALDAQVRAFPAPPDDGYADDPTAYDEEIGEAIEIIRE